MFRYLIAASLLFLLAPALVLAQAFTPDRLIEDSRFSDAETLGGASGIQRFLEAKGSVLANTSPDFLVKLREPEQSLKERLPDPRPNLGRLRTAAELIFDAASHNGLNPQVILATLQKEQSLINKNFASGTDLKRALDRSLGFGCPDGGLCGEIFLGFYHQLFGNFDAEGNRFIGMPASLMRSFNYEAGGARVGRGPMVDGANNAFGSSARVRSARVGDLIVLENTQGGPNSAPATQSVTLSNFATAALYRYTPHVYNGNFNFWKFFNEWFRYPNGTLVRASAAGGIYVIENGFRRPVSQFVINQRNLDAGSIVTLSASEFSEFAPGEAMTPIDGTLVGDSLGKNYLVEGGKLKFLSSFVAAQRGLSLAGSNPLPDEEIATYPDGEPALPEEGTLVKSSDNPAVYMITNNQKRLLSGFVFKQRGLSFSDVLVAQAGELGTYPTGPLLPPKDGTLLKAASSPAVYHVSNGLLQPMALFVFQSRGFSFRDVTAVSESELASWEQTSPMPPATGTLAKGEGAAAVYYFEAGLRRGVSFDAFRSRGFDFKDVKTVSGRELEIFEQGDDLPLADRALIKLEGAPTVYWLVDDILRPLSLTAFQNRGFVFGQIQTIGAEEFAKYPVGGVVEN